MRDSLFSGAQVLELQVVAINMGQKHTERSLDNWITSRLEISCNGKGYLKARKNVLQSHILNINHLVQPARGFFL